MSFKWDFEKGELVEGENPRPRQKAWGVVLAVLTGFGVWFIVWGYKILGAALLGVFM